MDQEQEQLQFLGFIGIFKESISIILSRPKIFTKISFAFILPLTFIALANIEITKLLSKKLISPTNNKNGPTSLFSSNWILFWVYNVAYIIITLIFSLFVISAVVYTVACIYTGKEVTFKKVVSVIPRVWKRLMITLVSNFCIIFAYLFVCLFVMFLCGLIFMLGIDSKPSDIQMGITIITIIMVILASIGISCMAIFWQLASVISVMENYCGFKAMKKSMQLIKGKSGTAIAIFSVISISSMPIVLLSKQLNKSDYSNVGIGPIMLYGILSFLLNTLITLYSLVVHSVFYFVCKSYHHENINKSTLADHLEAFHGHYVPLMKGDIEIERLNV